MSDSDDVLNGRFKLLERAGTGGMSTVYKGQDLMLGRIVAIKLLHENLTGDLQFLQRFQREAHAAANLAHPNIVTVHDIGRDGRRYYIVMEYIEGSTLKDLIRGQLERTGRPLPTERALNLAIQLCAGVGYAHRADLVHCDVKSQNMLVTQDDQLKVTDFGIARALSEASRQQGSVIWGTPQYFSPEQAAGERATPASDVYSIGVILFEMLTGRLPFDAESPTALAVQHMRRTPPNVTQYNPAVPPQLEQIIVKVLSKEPSGRYRTAGQLGSILTTYCKSSMEDTGPVLVANKGSAAVSEQVTAVYDYSDLSTADASLTKKPTMSVLAATGYSDLHLRLPEEDTSTDWPAIILGILAFISLLGLIPLWYLVYLRYAG